VWLAFVLMLTIFHHSKAKTFCSESFLARKMKLAISQASFLLSVQESSPNKKILL
jgi:hypothetical protein